MTRIKEVLKSVLFKTSAKLEISQDYEQSNYVLSTDSANAIMILKIGILNISME